MVKSLIIKPMNKTKIKVDIIADVVCPWCYLGEFRFKKAAEELKDKFEFQISLKPFELDPNTPVQGKDLRSYLQSRFGSEEAVEESFDHITGIAADEGLHYDFNKIKTIPNTFKAHRLIWFAGRYGKSIEVADALYKAYFLDGKNVNDTNLLAEIISKFDIREEDVARFFQEAEGTQEVKELEIQARQNGILSVPAFIINNKYLISGAQSTETFKRVIEKIAAEETLISQAAESCDDVTCE